MKSSKGLTCACCVLQCKEILQEEEDLTEIVQLVGKVSALCHKVDSQAETNAVYIFC